jgi:hypothetical protein
LQPWLHDALDRIDPRAHFWCVTAIMPAPDFPSVAADATSERDQTDETGRYMAF